MKYYSTYYYKCQVLGAYHPQGVGIQIYLTTLADYTEALMK